MVHPSRTRRGAAVLVTALAGVALLSGCGTKAPDPVAEAVARTQFTFRASPWGVADPHPDMKSYSAPAPAHKTQYNITATFDPETVVLKAQQDMVFTNDESIALGELYFHLFANAPYFQRDEKEARRSREGYMHILKVTANDQLVVPEGDGQMLHFQLPQPLEPGQALKLQLTWAESIPTTPDRLGQIGQNFYLGNWYPTLAVHDQGGWHIDRYYKDSDPLFSVTSDYDVNLTLPEAWQVGATGHKESVAKQGGSQTVRFVAKDVRDFAWAAGPAFTYRQGSVDGIALHYFEDTSGGTTRLTGGQNLRAEDALRVVAESISHFNQMFGRYPYQDFTIVGREGMEYPGFIMSEPQVSTLAHETAHQWWYGVLGNDENRQIWDEGLTTWSQQDPMRARGQAVRYVMPAISERMTKTLYEYGKDAQWNRGAIGSSLYSRAAVFWELLREKMGDSKFYGMLQQMYRDHKFGVLTWEDWHQAVLHHGGPEMETYWHEWVESDARPSHYPENVFIPGVTPIRQPAQTKQF